MLRKTIMFTKNTLFDCVHARCARSTTSRTKSFRHDDDADGAGNITRYNTAKDNLAKCKHGYVHTCVCRGGIRCVRALHRTYKRWHDEKMMA